jgi:hypothetical protein
MSVPVPVPEGGAEVKLTLDQIETLREAALPLMQWLNDNCHPHCTVIVDSERIELVEGLATARRKPIQKEVQK